MKWKMSTNGPVELSTGLVKKGQPMVQLIYTLTSNPTYQNQGNNEDSLKH